MAMSSGTCPAFVPPFAARSTSASTSSTRTRTTVAPSHQLTCSIDESLARLGLYYAGVLHAQDIEFTHLDQVAHHLLDEMPQSLGYIHSDTVFRPPPSPRSPSTCSAVWFTAEKLSQRLVLGVDPWRSMDPVYSRLQASCCKKSVL